MADVADGKFLAKVIPLRFGNLAGDKLIYGRNCLVLSGLETLLIIRVAAASESVDVGELNAFDFQRLLVATDNVSGNVPALFDDFGENRLAGTIRTDDSISEPRIDSKLVMINQFNSCVLKDIAFSREQIRTFHYCNKFAAKVVIFGQYC